MQKLSITITANHGFFKQGTTVADFGAGIKVTSLTVNDANHATAAIEIDSTAPDGPRNVTLTTNNNASSLAAGFTVGK